MKKNIDSSINSQYSRIRQLVTTNIQHTNKKFRKLRTDFKEITMNVKRIDIDLHAHFLTLLPNNKSQGKLDTDLDKHMIVPTVSTNLDTYLTNISNNLETDKNNTIECPKISTKRISKYESLEKKCKSIAIHEKKIYQINKILAEKYEEELNNKKVGSTKKLTEVKKPEYKKADSGIFSFLCGESRKISEDEKPKEEDGCAVF